MDRQREPGIPTARLKGALDDRATFQAWIECYDAKMKLSRFGGWWILRPLHLGMLPVRSGQLVAGDPGLEFDMTGPFARTIPPGEYEVWASIAVPTRRAACEPGTPLELGDSPLVAFLTLLVTSEPPARFELAALQKPDGDRPIDEDPGFGVDSAQAALMDAAYLPAVRRAEGTLDAWGLAHEAQFGPEGLKGLAALVELATTPPAPAAVCVSGWGDGAYRSYFGLDARGQPVRLTIDFNLAGHT